MQNQQDMDALIITATSAFVVLLVAAGAYFYYLQNKLKQALAAQVDCVPPAMSGFRLCPQPCQG